MARSKKGRGADRANAEAVDQPASEPTTGDEERQEAAPKAAAPKEEKASMRADMSRGGYSGTQQVVEDEDQEDLLDAQPAGLGSHPAAQKRPLKSVDPTVTVTLSRQLVDRLQRTAAEEGIDMQGLLSELLAEAVTLRAWEIIERKSQMRGGNQGGGNQGNFRGGGNQGGGGGNNRHRHRGGGGHGGGGHGGGGGNQRRGQGGNAWMEDKAAFLEYVRNQEKRRR